MAVTLAEINATLGNLGQEQERTTKAVLTASDKISDGNAVLQSVASKITQQMEAAEKSRLSSLNQKNVVGLGSVQNNPASPSKSDEAGFGGGLLGGLGVGLGALGMGMKKAATGVAALGLALPAFFGGLLAGSAGLEWLQDTAGLNFDGLKKAAIGFTDIIMEMDPKAFIVLAGIMGISAVGGTQSAKGLSTMGFAISAFLGGLLAGDLVFSGVKALGGNLDFAGMKSAMVGFSDMITSLDPKAITVLAGIMGLSAITGMKSGDPLGSAKALGAMGLGISAFLGGLLLGNDIFEFSEAMGAKLDFPSLQKVFAGFSMAIETLSPKSMIAMATLLTASSAMAAYGKDKSTALNTVAIMSAMGAGISGFLIGLTIGDVGIGWLSKIGDADGTALTSAFKMFDSSIGALSVEGIAALSVLIGAAALIKTDPITLGKNMLGLSAGIAGFLGGLVLGEKGISWLGAIPSGSEDGLVSAFKMFNASILALSPEAMTALGVLMLAAPAGTAIATGLPMIGVGIAGFLVALAAGDVITAIAAYATGGQPGESLKMLLTNIFEGLGAASALGTGTDLIALGAGLTAIAVGLGAFGVGNLVGTLASVGTSLLEWIGVEGPIPQLLSLAKEASKLTEVANALEVIANALGKFASIEIDTDNVDFKGLAEKLGQAIPTLKALATGGFVEGSAGWFNGGITFPEGGILNPNLKLNEMVEAIGKVNIILGKSLSMPNGSGSSGGASVSNITPEGGTTVADIIQNVSIVKISDEVLTALTTALMQRDYAEVTATSSAGGGSYTDARSTTIAPSTSMGISMPMGPTVDVLDGGFADRRGRGPR